MNTTGTYIDMGPTVPKVDQQQEEETKDETIVEETATTVDMGVNSKLTLTVLVF